MQTRRSGSLLGACAALVLHTTIAAAQGPAPPTPSLPALPGEPSQIRSSPPAARLRPSGSAAATGAAAADEVMDVIRTQVSEILNPQYQPIDLNTALQVAGVQNPDLLIARQRVVEAVALQQYAAAQFLPSINAGMNYDTHTGVLQQSNGNILSVQRQALYVGAGANAIAAGTVNIPGIVLTGNVTVAIYGYLTSRQVVAQREFATIAQRNQTFLQVALAYSELLRAEGKRAIAIQAREDVMRIARLSEAYAVAGQGLQSDANRASTELANRDADIQAAEGEILVASARLAYVLNVDPSIRFHPTDGWVAPFPIVPDPIPVRELIALGLLRRPELGDRRAAIAEAMLNLEGANVLPFSPTILLGFSGGGFGGGSNLVSPVFGGFGGRSDIDAFTYWTLQNLGVGNLALIRLARARLGVSQYQEIAVMDRVRAEVAEAYAKTHARFAQIRTTSLAVRSGVKGYEEDLIRIQNRVTPAIEVVDSMRLLARSRYAYLDSIVDYNRAQFELYVALGQPPANSLARPVPVAGVAPSPTPGTFPPRQPPVPAAPDDGDAAPPEAARARPARSSAGVVRTSFDRTTKGRP